MTKTPFVVFLTGIPGTGKSTTAQIIKEKCNERDLRTLFINDYPYLIKWANLNRSDETKVQWFMQESGVENFNIVPSAYRELSAWIAAQIGEEIKELSGQYEVFVLESARGAGVDGNRDRYDSELFEPLESVLGTTVEFINIEMVVRDISIVLDRMTIRLEGDPTAAPPFIAEKYISSAEGVQSAFNQAMLSRINFLLNELIDNSGEKEQAELKALGIVMQLLAYWNAEGHEGPVAQETTYRPSHRKES